jgi:protein SCO1/2
MTARAFSILLSATLLVSLATAAHAQRPGAEVEYVPNNELPAGVVVHEQLGAKVDLDAPMFDQDGKPRTLRSLLGDRPVLLTFNYSSCPGLCSVHLNRLVEALGAAKLAPGSTYRLVTVVLAPEETAVRTARTRQQYLDKLAKLGAPQATDDGWTFLVARPGDDAKSIRAIADSVGFGYQKVQGQYAHPAAIIALATDGTVTRYVHGVELVGSELATTIIKAGLHEPSTAAGYVLACFHLAPTSHNARVARDVMRFAALGFVTILLGIGGFVLFVRRHRSPPNRPSGVMPS